MMNTAYRKSRGTHKPFSRSEEQAKAIWDELIRKEEYQYRPSVSEYLRQHLAVN